MNFTGEHDSCKQYTFLTQVCYRVDRKKCNLTVAQRIISSQFSLSNTDVHSIINIIRACKLFGFEHNNSNQTKVIKTDIGNYKNNSTYIWLRTYEFAMFYSIVTVKKYVLLQANSFKSGLRFFGKI